MRKLHALCYAICWFVAHGTIIERNTQNFLKLAKNATYPYFTDKIVGHSYQLMYGTFLLPLVKEFHHNKEKFKMFEVGMGCNPSTMLKKKGVDIWRAMLDPERDELWMAEYSTSCVQAMREKGAMPPHVNVVTGDQGNKEVLERWVQESGGNFDVFIDDGGHYNSQIYNTFQVMWDQVKPGGFYFIEDLHVSRTKTYEDTNGELIMVDVISDWNEQLIIPSRKPLVKHKLPSRVKFIMCQAEACVISKCAADDSAWCSK